MGQGVSQEEMDAVGYRVLGVEPKSPASTAGLVSFFVSCCASDHQPPLPTASLPSLALRELTAPAHVSASPERTL